MGESYLHTETDNAVIPSNGIVTNTPITSSELPVVGLIFPPAQIPGNVTVEIVTGHQLRPASADEERQLRAALESSSGNQDLLTPYLEERRRAMWNTDAPHRGQPSEKYFAVIEKQGPTAAINDGFIDFEHACLLAGVTAKPRVVWILHGSNGLFSSMRTPNFVGPWEFWSPSAAELTKIRATDDLVKGLPSAHSQIREALKLFWRVASQGDSGTFYFAKLMSVVECLLTYEGRRSGDSISRQIRLKVPLLLKRANVPASPFSGSPEEVWMALYSLRSSIAHGRTPRFGEGQLSRVPDPRSAVKYLESAVAALLVQALKEPEFVKALADG